MDCEARVRQGCWTKETIVIPKRPEVLPDRRVPGQNWIEHEIMVLCVLLSPTEKKPELRFDAAKSR